ncbi:polyketide cyclase/dehydrase and lipid transporter [Tricharina praecox]|uniref:polyketide cyclase/dehydrase and lipid transporter n=1 Tax=Tricharina praecox TaxID=43433 RepID=UPI00221FCB2B|nr:polyketide cyclase/dehydrase and lipid transporter [Tricharina praecox]KAI5844229.1 polyketide cyclase/dehydrase and lipid transporter [Tricharina praecox]
MSLAVPLRPLLRPLRPCSRRTFFDLPTASPQRFTASRRLPHPPAALYRLISDIDAYHEYLPYCLGSRITSRCPDTNTPTEADLRVGWGAFDETFRSRVTCIPERLSVQADASQNPLFKQLKARWEIKDSDDGHGGDVSLHIEFAFANPLYAAVGGAVAPKVAGVMVDAFEKRAREVLKIVPT